MLNILKRYFGYDQFRPLQQEIIQHTIDGNDSLVLMPTGGGKSLCFQVPALMLDGVSIVISPLISLMKDQVDTLKAHGIEAEFINSTQAIPEQNKIIQKARNGKLKLLYISPERFISGLDEFLTTLPLSLLAIDEAHCISSWGHDFRPEYMELSSVKKRMPKLPIIALTATADKTTRKDILNQLGLSQPKVFTSSFNRPNLSLKVRAGLKKGDKHNEILNFIQLRADQSGIVYCLSRKSCEEVASFLRTHRISAEAYHAGLPAKDREIIQSDFINDNVSVICATIAFGMGIDKSNVRYVIHYNMPKNMEGYYQEIGRAGRDGLPSDTVVYFTYQDIVLLSRFIDDSGQKELNREKLRRMQQYVEAPTCRRKVLLSYFGEQIEKNCNNCDVCKNPPKQFDATIIVQKALSGIARMNQSVGANLLINFLKGSPSVEIKRRGFSKLKTYGVGADITYDYWRQYILQMLDHGFIEIAYDDNNALKITELGNKVLFKGQKVMLVHAKEKESIKIDKTESTTKRAIDFTDSKDQKLFIALKELRATIANKRHIPPYIIFGDNSLKQMTVKKPISGEQFLTIVGVGEHKLRQYGPKFIELIYKFCIDNKIETQQLIPIDTVQKVVKVKKAAKKATKVPKLSTIEKTKALVDKGFTAEEIATSRGISYTTVCSHIVELYESGLIRDLSHFVSDEEIDLVQKAIVLTKSKGVLKPIYEKLDEKVSYSKIRFAILVLRDNGFI